MANRAEANYVGIDGSAALLPQTESAEALSFLGQDFLVTGGGRGTGRQVALDIVSRGGRVALGTRNPAFVESFINEAKQLQKKGGISDQITVGDNIRPFTVNLIDDLNIAIEIMELKDSGFKLAGWVHAAAEGMQTYATRKKLLGEIVTLRGIKKRKSEEEFQEARRALQGKLARWVWQAMPGAMKSNYEGPKFLLDELRAEHIFRDGAKIINFGSVWTDQIGQPDVEVPLWYWPVCTKQSFDLELQDGEKRADLERHGIYPYTVIGQVIDNTDVGDLFRGGIFELLSPEERAKYGKITKPMTTADMSKAVQIMLLSDPHDTELWTPGQPRKLYVLGPTGTEQEARENIVRELPRNHPMLTFKSPI